MPGGEGRRSLTVRNRNETASATTFVSTAWSTRRGRSARRRRPWSPAGAAAGELDVVVEAVAGAALIGLLEHLDVALGRAERGMAEVLHDLPACRRRPSDRTLGPAALVHVTRRSGGRRGRPGAVARWAGRESITRTRRDSSARVL